jgi:ABC-type oligopeptide transport system ATPase subunit
VEVDPVNDDATPVAAGKPGMALEVHALGKTFVGRERSSVAIGEVGFEVADREFGTVVGPSGCG